jgi:neuromedin B
MTRRAGGARLLGGLLLFLLLAAGVAPLSWDLPEPRSRTSKIRVHPRGNLWATGKLGDPSKRPSTLLLSPLAAPSDPTRGHSSNSIDGELETPTVSDWTQQV